MLTARVVNAFFLALVSGALVWQLFIPPALSVANDNDFQKLAGRYCLGNDSRTGTVLFDYTSMSPGIFLRMPASYGPSARRQRSLFCWPWD